GVSLDEILYVLRALLDADEMMRESPHPRVELEIATVRSTRRPVPQALEEVLRRVDEAEARLRGAGIARAAAPPAAVQQSILDAPGTPRASGSGPGPAARAPRSGRGMTGDPGRGYAPPQGAVPPRPAVDSAGAARPPDQLPSSEAALSPESA